MGTHNDLTPIKSRIVGYDTKPADQFNAHPHNWRKHPQRQREAVAASLRELGWIAPVIENRQTGNLIDGHERVWQALQRGEDVPYMVVDLSPEEEALALATFDAITGMAETDAEALDRLLAEVSTGEAALMELIAETRASAGDVTDGPLDLDNLFSFDDLPLPDGVPDALWPSENEYGIPTLDITRQADAIDLPIEIWGAKGRGTKAGTLLFYTEDYRFNAIWDSPADVLRAAPVVCAEPNYSVYQNFPRAIAIYRTYQKRWLARFWQSRGVRILVDLNVNPDYYDINWLGVPEGWAAYATRGYSDRIDYLLGELEQAEAHAGGPVLFLVYGGGQAVVEWCQAHAGRGVVHSVEEMQRGRYG